MRPPISIALLLACTGCGKTPDEQPHPPISPQEATAEDDLRNLIRQGSAFTSISFTKLIKVASGRNVIPFNAARSPETSILNGLAGALDKTLAELNQDSSPVRQLRRINEASRFFEDAIAAHMDKLPGFSCEFPKSATGKVQRSGYPDLKITHLASGRICYLDPKLFESSSRGSTLRTFYYQPRTRTGKIHYDAHHLVVGIEHDGNDGAWRFTGWELVDLAGLKLRIKTEFQGSNRDIYRDELILRRSKR